MADPKKKTNSGAVTGGKTEAKAKTRSETKVKARSEPKVKTKSETKIKTKSESKVKAGSAPIAKVKSDTKAGANTENKRQKLSVDEHDLIKYLIENSSENNKVSINDMAEYFTALIDIAANNGVPDFHQLDRDMYEDVFPYIAELKKGKRSIVNDSVRVQVKRLIAKFLDRELVGNIKIKCTPDLKHIKSAAREYYAETPFSESEIMMIREAIGVFPYAENDVTEKIVDGLNRLTPLSNRQDVFRELLSEEKYCGSYYENLKEIHKAFARSDSPVSSKRSKRNIDDEHAYKKIKFKYCRYNIEKKLEVYTPASGNETRIVNPLRAIWANGYYYLATFEYDAVNKRAVYKNYRIDRMKDVECLTDEADSPKNYFTGEDKKIYEIWRVLQKKNSRTPIMDPRLTKKAMNMESSGLMVWDYIRMSTIMFSHDFLPEIKIKCGLSLMNNAIDFFGFDFDVEELENNEFIMTLHNKAAGGVKMFALEYGDGCEVLEPAMLRESITRSVENMSRKYCNS